MRTPLYNVVLTVGRYKNCWLNSVPLSLEEARELARTCSQRGRPEVKPFLPILGMSREEAECLFPVGHTGAFWADCWNCHHLWCETGARYVGRPTAPVTCPQCGAGLLALDQRPDRPVIAKAAS